MKAANDSMISNGATPIQANTPRRQNLKPLTGRQEYQDTIVAPIINIRSPV